VGATTFVTGARGESAGAAFRDAVESAQYESGHGGYTGTIAEKHSFNLLPVPAGVQPQSWPRIVLGACVYHGSTRESRAAELKERHGLTDAQINVAFEQYEQVDDKWGPAGCVDLGDGKFAFFGWASE